MATTTQQPAGSARQDCVVHSTRAFPRVYRLVRPADRCPDGGHGERGGREVSGTTETVVVDEPTMLIGGRPTRARAEETFEAVDPSSGEVIARPPRARGADVADAVAAA